MPMSPAVLHVIHVQECRHASYLPLQVGRDSRLSGPLLLASMVAGLASQGVSVAQFGLATTPAMFMSCIIPGQTPKPKVPL